MRRCRRSQRPSHRTIGFHLYRLFPKLGITSRNQLRGALDVDELTA